MNIHIEGTIKPHLSFWKLIAHRVFFLFACTVFSYDGSHSFLIKAAVEQFLPYG